MFLEERYEKPYMAMLEERAAKGRRKEAKKLE
jgi:hypothetical protein